MLRIHLGPLDRIDHYGQRICGPMSPSGGSLQPVVVIGRHQHELSPAVLRYFHWFALCPMLDLAEFALEFKGCNL
jgi:hypothetical protein